MIKILHYVPSYNYGGIETFTYEISKKLKDKCEFTYLVEYEVSDEIKKKLSSLNSKFIKIPNLKNEGKLKHLFSIIKVFKSEKYDVVHVHDCNIRFFVMLIAKLYKVKKRIYHIHSIVMSGNKIKRMIKKIGFKINIKFSNIILSCSNEAAQNKLKKEKYIVINNGIELNNFIYNENDRKEMRKKIKVSDENILLLCVGRLVPIKNYSFMLNVFEKLVKINQKYMLLFVGDGEEKDNLYMLAEKKDLLNNVKFLGKQDCVNKFYSASDIFCLPSIREGLAIVLIEAQINGIPCIASSNVPIESNVTNCVKYIDANTSEDVDKWVEYINNTNFKRYNKYDLIKKKGYDINDSSKKIYEIYIK